MTTSSKNAPPSIVHLLTQRMVLLSTSIALIGSAAGAFSFYPTTPEPLAIRVALGLMCLTAAVLTLRRTWHAHLSLASVVVVCALACWQMTLLYTSQVSLIYAFQTPFVLMVCLALLPQRLSTLVGLAAGQAALGGLVLWKATPGFPKASYVIFIFLLAVTIWVLQQLVFDSITKAQRRREEIHKLLNHVREAYFLLDPTGLITSYNRRAQDFAVNIWQRRVAEGDDLTALMASAPLPDHAHRYQKAQHGLTVHFEARLLDLQRETHWYEVRYVPEFDARGDVAGVVISLLDITDRKRSKAALEQRNEELKKTNFELDRFVYSAAHDLRAPLTSVLGLLNVIRLSSQDADTLRYLALIEQSINRLDRFVKDIIAYSRNSRTTIERKPIDLREVLQEALQQSQFVENTTTVTQLVNIMGEETPFYSDENRLADIFKNLISNAIRYADPHKPQSFLHIDIHIYTDYARIQVRDNGVGIREEHLHKIFDMFYRGTERSGGAGLGLYIVRETVTRLNGEVRVTSEFGEGTSFEMVLPNYSGPKEPAPADPDEGSLVLA